LTSTFDLERHFSISIRERYRHATQQTLWGRVHISQIGGVGSTQQTTQELKLMTGTGLCR